MNVLERDFFTDPEILQDPLPYYRALHERGPVLREPHKGVFMLSRMDGAMSADDLLDVSGMARPDALRVLARLVVTGVVIMKR